MRSSPRSPSGLWLPVRAIACLAFLALCGASWAALPELSAGPSAEAIYTTPTLTNSLTVTIVPEEAALAGGRWRLGVDGAWRESGDVLEQIEPGRYTVEFTALVEWGEPDPLSFVIIDEVAFEKEVEYTPLPLYSIRQDPGLPPDELTTIPPQKVWHGDMLEFLVRDELTSVTMLLVDEGIDDISFDVDTGLFRYTPAEDEKRPFAVTFGLLSGPEDVTETVIITPRPRLRPEQANMGLATASVPSRTDEKYILQTVRSGPELLFNDAIRKTRIVDVVGIDIIIEEGSTQNNIYQFHEAEDIKELNISAERVIFRSPLVLPQTDVTIHARELRFEDPGQGPGRAQPAVPSYLDVTPRPRALQPGLGESGESGHDCGTITLFIERFHSDEGDLLEIPQRFILRGGRGGDAGDGRDGADGSSVPTISRGTLTGGFDFSDTGDWFFEDIVKEVARDGGGPCQNRDNGRPANGESATPPGREGQGGRGGTLISPMWLFPYADLQAGANGTTATPPDRGYWKGGEAGSPRNYYQMECWHWEDCFIICYREHLQLSRSYLGSAWNGQNAFLPAAQPGNESGQNFPLAGRNGWMRPVALQQMVARGRDAYFEGNLNGARDILKDYEELVSLQLSYGLTGHLSPEELMEVQSIQQEISNLLHRIDNGLDYFGNPSGWVPMLSFEVNFINLDNEIERAIPVLYLTYWLNNIATTFEQRSQGLQSTRDALRTDLESMRDEYAQVQGSISPLMTEAQVITSKINKLSVELQELEEELLNEAIKTVEERNKVPWWKQALRVAGSILKVIPVYQPALGMIGQGADIVADFDPHAPLDTLGDLTGLAGQFSSSTFSQSAKNTEEELKKLDFTKIESAGDMASYLGNIGGHVANFAGCLQDIKGILKKEEIPQGEVEEELARLKAETPRFAELMEDIEALGQEKVLFAEKLAKAMQAVTRLSQEIMQTVLAIDAMNVELDQINSVLSPRTQAYVNEMERRQLDRLEKYFYYMRKSYEYRMLQEYPAGLDLGVIYEEFSELAQAGTEELSQEQIGALVGVYKEQLATVAAAIFDELNTSSIELEATAQTSLTEAERRQLNETGEVTINLLERRMFGDDQENIRIVSLETFKDSTGQTIGFDVTPVGAEFGENSTLRIQYEHSGISRLRSDGKTYFFRHFRRENSNPIYWETTYIPFDGSLVESRPSAASNSLLKTLLEMEGRSFDDLLLYSRPGAWADVRITKQFTQGFHDGTTPIASDAQLDRLRLKVVYDYYPVAGNQVSLSVETIGMEGMMPYVIVDTEDLDTDQTGKGRMDGRGSFRRVYTEGQTVTLEAEADYGMYEFAKWVDGNGQDFNPPQTDPSIEVSLDASQTVRALYEVKPSAVTLEMLRNHILGIAPLAEELWSAADENTDTLLDTGDVCIKAGEE